MHKLMLRILCSIRNRPKAFCIGRNKTGTTSLEKAFRDLGYIVGNQATAELLIHDYAQRDFRPIVEYCRRAEAFQDIPFSLPYTYQILDHAFPGSKFILSVRDDENVWYDSLIRFHQKRLGVQGMITREHLLNDGYRYKGFSWEANRIIYDTPENDPFEESAVKEHYLRHNQDVISYFKLRDNLLVLNLNEADGYQRFCAFLGFEPVYSRFPWLNKSSTD